ncbi:BTB/POZ and MATH domain-containing protein 4 [Morella rubra]|uniref:BTB/POZ and MATH domain-containing protein 4 n=1 Tax=Morella rubra TaxID=262757 RepID=A0A6A1VSV7_9ROSI|nr:BTB/POZ and MATH domain-containing protein 4 [Morella rubra]
METFETHREVFPPPSSASTSCTETTNGNPEFDIKGYFPDKGVEIGNYITSNTFAVACDDCVIYFSPDGTDCGGRRTQGRLQVLDEILGQILDCGAVAAGTMFLMLLVLGRMNTFLDSSRELFHHIMSIPRVPPDPATSPLPPEFLPTPPPVKAFFRIKYNDSTVMVNVVLHHEGKLSFACGDYIGGQVTHLGELDSDFISVTHLHKLLREDLGYKNFEGLWCKFEGEPFESGVNSLGSDADVIRILKRLEKDKLDTLHVYMEHTLDLPNIIHVDAQQLLLCGEPSQRPTATDGTVVEGGGQGSEREGGAQGRREQEGDGQERENERGREGDGNGQEREGEVVGDREEEESDGEDADSNGSEDEDGEDNDNNGSEDSDSSEDENLSDFFEMNDDEPELFVDELELFGDFVGEDDDSDGSEDEHLSNFFETDDDEPKLFGDFVGEDDDSDGREDEHLSNFSEIDNNELKLFGDFVGEDDNNNNSEDEHLSNFSEMNDDEPELFGDFVGEDDDSNGSEDEHLSKFSETDDDEPKLFGNFVAVDGKAVANELSGLDRHIDEASDHMDDQNHDVAAPITAHVDVHGESSTTHEAHVDAKKWFGSGVVSVDKVLPPVVRVRSRRQKKACRCIEDEPQNPYKPHMDDQNHDVAALATVHVDVHGESSMAHEAHVDAKKWLGSRVVSVDKVLPPMVRVRSRRQKKARRRTQDEPYKIYKGGDIEVVPSIGNKSEAGATKKMLEKGPKQKGASNDISGNENKDKVCYIMEQHEQNLKQWLHENSLFDHQQKNLNPQFLQILRDVLRCISDLHQVEKICHGNLSELNIVIVNSRGKITGMLNDVSKKYVDDYLSLAAIVRSCFRSQRQTIPIELELLLTYISTTKPSRVIAYTSLYFGKNKKSFELKLNEKLPKYDWKLKVRTFKMVLNRYKSSKSLPEKQMKSLQYHKSATSFMRFGRNIVVHLADIVNRDLGGKKLTAEEVEEELTGYWPEFMPILHQDSQVKPLGYFHENGTETDR